MIGYFDNAATSFPKPKIVCDEMLDCLTNYCANPGRGGHKLAIKSQEAVILCRKIISNFFGINNFNRLVFTKNATEALNIAIFGLSTEKSHIITSVMEHNSVIRPLKLIESKSNVKITFVKANKFGEIKIEDIKKSIKKNTKYMIFTLASNVNGSILPIEEIGKLAKKTGIIFILDTCQGAGSININVNEFNIDILVFTGHKGLFGPQGIGGLYVKEGLELKPFIVGGTGSNSKELIQPSVYPDYFESGTLNTPGIVGLKAGIEFINSVGLKNIENKKDKITRKFHEEVRKIRGIKVYSSGDVDKNSGILALNFDNCDSIEISNILSSEYNIATRGGFHCSPYAHKSLNTYKSGIVRFSFGYFNTMDEIDYILDVLQKISKKKYVIN